MGKNEEDVGTGLVGAPACGDVMKLQIRVNPDDNTISDVKFKTFGCGSAIASSSYLTELVRGMTLEQAGKVRNTEIAKELCLPPVKRKCFVCRLVHQKLLTAVSQCIVRCSQKMPSSPRFRITTRRTLRQRRPTWEARVRLCQRLRLRVSRQAIRLLLQPELVSFARRTKKFFNSRAFGYRISLAKALDLSSCMILTEDSLRLLQKGKK